MTVGVVVGRFQVHALHAGHVAVFEAAEAAHDRVLCVVGVPPVALSPTEPLSVKTRRGVVRALFPDVKVVPLADCLSDDEWSAALDALVTKHARGETAVLYAGPKKNWVPRYTGGHPVHIVDEEKGPDRMMGQQVGILTQGRWKDNESFAAGVMWAAHQPPPRVIAAVTVAVFNSDRDVLLVAGKEFDGWRLPWAECRPTRDGGDGTDEGDAVHAARVASGLTLRPDRLRYAGSGAFPDWRYRGSRSEVRYRAFTGTTVARTNLVPEPNSGLAEARWWKPGLTRNVMHEAHLPILVATMERGTP